MAYHFEARGDSSDEEATSFSLSAWKAGVSSDTVVQHLDKVAASGTSTTQNGAQSELRDIDSASAPGSVFPLIDRGAQATTSGSGRSSAQVENIVSIDSDEPLWDVAQNGSLVPVIDRHAIDQSQYEDLTAGSDSVRRVLRQLYHQRRTVYQALFDDFHVEELSLPELLAFDNGPEALDNFASASASDSDSNSRGLRRKRANMVSTRRDKRQRHLQDFVSTVDNIDGSDQFSSEDEISVAPHTRSKDKRNYVDFPASEDEDDDEVEDLEEEYAKRPVTRRQQQVSNQNQNMRRSNRSAGRSETANDDGDSSDDDFTFLRSDLPGVKRRKTSRHGRYNTSEEAVGTRHSGRSTRHLGNMREVEIGDSYHDGASTKDQPKPKPISTKEVFKVLPRNNDFRMRHNQYCDTCGDGSNIAALIDCQGCSLTYHKSCLGNRGSRDHLVTKIGEEDFVLQCRRCVAAHRKKDRTSPDQGKCQDCYQHGAGCMPFRPKKTPAQEQRERDENGGTDPICEVDPSLVNNASNVLFRCLSCFRAFHFEHLPSRSDLMELGADIDAEQRFRDYSRDWKCKECLEMPGKVSGIVAWKPVDEDNYDPALGLDGLDEEGKIYLVKWEGMSYFRARWMPGPWVWGVTAHAMRKAFSKRDGSQHPKMRTEDAIPEDYLRADIVLDIKYTSIVDIRTEEIDKARIREIDQALVKYKGLGYQDAVWEAPPAPEDGDRWMDFVTAYHAWIAGRYVRQPKPPSLRNRLEKARAQNFESLEKQTQPDNLDGGKLMEYQLQGVNWLYYKWITQKNAILADEMGLGKTIQIIGFFATLVQDWNCFPFLVVVPNSTCPNWRREIKQWAPSLRVVAYYGVREARDLAYRYELFPENSKELRCHIVVTSYEAVADEDCRKFFRSVHWQALVIDEGQRLKNDKSNLYAALGAVRTSFKVLLTGTPLQNNQRELFNLLHFLDDSMDAAELEQRYENLDQEKITELHEMIRPFFLRRTKAQVLTFLPPMAQIIIPVSMTLVQKKLYRNILAKNPELMRAVFSTDASVKQNERANLSNILMQLRKCLCHPFVYNKSIEERNVSTAASHRNLVDASSKLKLLELLLPKLKADGHRVLIFSQFLHMLDIVEDFFDGMELMYHRLDGSVSSVLRQSRIDEFNAPDSKYFAFLLSTRAGGVGINLATADTVIVLDPDFNPHQDIQALSRAHRIGQKNKVLCFQIVTRSSAEERMMQIGRKKLALDHVLITQMDEEDAGEQDLVSILRHGAAEIFADDGESDINYDSASIEKLLDRSQMEDTGSGGDRSAETLFSQARVWAHDQGTLGDVMTEREEQTPDPGVWASILKERERIAAEEAAAKAASFGRGRRARANIDYKTDADGVETGHGRQASKRKDGDDSDTDFQAEESADDDDEEDVPVDEAEKRDAAGQVPEAAKTKTIRKADPKPETSVFRRVVVPQFLATPQGFTVVESATQGPSTHTPPQYFQAPGINCRACQTYHPIGSCPFKLAGVEYCNLCGLAHFGHARVCPHIQSETQVRAMLDALNYSNEPEHLKAEARKYLRGLKGSLVQMKKQKTLLKSAAREAQAQGQAPGPVHSQAHPHAHAQAHPQAYPHPPPHAYAPPHFQTPFHPGASAGMARAGMAWRY